MQRTDRSCEQIARAVFIGGFNFFREVLNDHTIHVTNTTHVNGNVNGMDIFGDLTDRFIENVWPFPPGDWHPKPQAHKLP